MKRIGQALFVVAFLVTLIVAAARAQSQRGGGGGQGAAKPVRSCESLASIALPNTTVESAAVDPNNPSVCRVTAFSTHPPAGDKIRIWIGIPMSDWNGRFLGTGGGGFSGGNAGGLNQPVAQGYAAGATDTGHEGGSGSFALGAD